MILPQRTHDALIAILRAHQPQAAGRLLLDLEELIGRELAAEREACARVAEAMVAKSGPRGVARAIRARTEGGTE